MQIWYKVFNSFNGKQSAFPKWMGHPVQITGMNIKNVKALFWILNHCNCINSNCYQTTIAVKSKIWKHFCQRVLKRHVWPIIWLIDVMNLSNFLLMYILMCIIYWKLKRCMEHQLKANNHLSGQNILQKCTCTDYLQW